MKAHYRAFNGKLIVEVEGSTIKDLFEQIGPIAEVLDGDDACGKCGSPHIYPRAREAKKADGKIVSYYELVCSDCTAKLSFGQHSEGGTLWAKRTDEQGNCLDHRGWKVYQALAAPKPAPAKADPPKATNAPRPAAGPAVDSGELARRLTDTLKRCTSLAETGQVHGEMCDALDGFIGKSATDSTWQAALLKHGDPAIKPEAVRGVTEFLLRKMMEQEILRAA